MVTLFLVAALLGTPEGFRDSVRLEPIAGTVVPGVSVYCPRTEAVWRTEVGNRFPEAPWNRVGGFYETGAGGPDELYLSPWGCRALEGWLRGKNTPTLRYLAVYGLTFVHELMHLRGIAGERDADCAALKALPGVLRTHFKVRSAATMRRVMAYAWADNRAKPAAYRC